VKNFHLDLTNEKDKSEINQLIYCGDCIETNVYELSHQQVKVGFTSIGLKVWCLQHDKEVIHIDFNNAKEKLKLLQRNCSCGDCDYKEGLN
jgi:hypothetical protein